MAIYRRWIPPLAIAFCTLVGFSSAQAQQPWDFAVSFSGMGGGFQFADSTYLSDMGVLGGTAGVDFGRGVQLRGYYWKGRDKELQENVPVQGYGGEVQLDLTIFSILKPFLMGGFGRMDFESTYENEQGQVPGEVDTWIIGGGLALDLTRWLRFDVTVRDYIFEQPRIGDEEIPDVRYNNLLLTGGLTLTFGRRKYSTPNGMDPSGVQGGTETIIVQAGAVVAGAEPGGVAQTPIPTGLSEELAAALSDPNLPTSTRAARNTIEAILAREIGYLDAQHPDLAPLGAPRRPIDGDRAQELNDLLAPRLHEAFDFLALYESAALMVELSAQLDAFNVSADGKEDILETAHALLDGRVAAVREDGAVFIVETDSLISWRRAEAAKRSRVAGEIGGSFGNGSQFLLGGQLSFPAPWGPRWGIVPEAQVGFGGGGITAVMQTGLRYYLDVSTWQAYGGAALGLIIADDKVGERSGSSLIVTPMLGVEIPPLRETSWLGKSYRGWFVEYQAVDLFDTHRLLVGMNWGV